MSACDVMQPDDACLYTLFAVSDEVYQLLIMQSISICKKKHDQSQRQPTTHNTSLKYVEAVCPKRITISHCN